MDEVSAINPRMMWADTFRDDMQVSFVPMAAVDDVSGSISTLETRPINEVWKGYTRFVDNDVLFAKITPCMENGKAAIAHDLKNGLGFGSTEFHVIRATEAILPEWIYYYIRQQSFRDNATASMTGTAGQLRVPSKYLFGVAIPIAPLSEQKRIVEAIEAQFTRLDAGVAALKRLQANLKRYKAAVLKAACEGRLVEQDANDEPASALLERILEERREKWEAEQRAKGKDPRKMTYDEPAAPDVEGLPELPEGWVYVSLDQIGELARGKSKHRPRNADFLYDGPYPFVQTGDIRHANGILKTYSQTYSEAGLAQSRLWPEGTLCITIAANIAETAILGFSACFPDSIVGFIPIDDSADIRFLEYFIRSAKNHIEQYAPATAQKNINLDTLQKLAIPYPSLNEQRQIANEVERGLSIIDDLNETVRAGLKRAERLRQAILREAFAGRLVAQDPADEAAEALLARIRAARAASTQATGKGKRGRGKNGKK
ncbi:MAG: restriction endonuclease subunit S [Anaerolineae bacterium]